MYEYKLLIVILVSAVTIQILTAYFAFRLINVTGYKWSWGLISIAIFGMAIRRLIPLYAILNESAAAIRLDVFQESIGLLISVVTFFGVFLIKPLFLSIKKLNIKLTKLNAAKDKMFSVISHDLKGPLGIVLCYADILEEKIGDCSSASKEAKMVASNIQKAARNINSMLDSLFNWSFVQRGKIKFSPEDIRLSDVLKESVEIFRPIAENKKITIVTNISDHNFVSCDRDMIGLIFRNILSNAIKFSFKDSKIIVSAIRENDFIVVSVEDIGVGISEDKCKVLFMEDYNDSTPGTEFESGSGLGLQVSRELVEMSGGQIWVTSCEGKGSTFSFTIPVKNKKQQAS